MGGLTLSQSRKETVALQGELQWGERDEGGWGEWGGERVGGGASAGFYVGVGVGVVDTEWGNC